VLHRHRRSSELEQVVRARTDRLVARTDEHHVSFDAWSQTGSADARDLVDDLLMAVGHGQALVVVDHQDLPDVLAVDPLAPSVIEQGGRLDEVVRSDGHRRQHRDGVSAAEHLRLAEAFFQLLQERLSAVLGSTPSRHLGGLGVLDQFVIPRNQHHCSNCIVWNHDIHQLSPVGNPSPC